MHLILWYFVFRPKAQAGAIARYLRGIEDARKFRQQLNSIPKPTFKP
jgi:hypothetical protein